MSCDASTIQPTLLRALGTWQSRRVTKYLPSWSLNYSGEWQKANQQTLMSGGDKCYNEGLPWWLSGKESSCRYRRYMFDSWSGKIPHAAEQLSPRAKTSEPVLNSLGPTATEPTCCNYWALLAIEPVLCNQRNHRNKKPVRHNSRAGPAHCN